MKVVGVALPLTIHPMQESLALSEGGASGIAAGVVLGFSCRSTTGTHRKWVRFPDPFHNGNMSNLKELTLKWN